VWLTVGCGAGIYIQDRAMMILHTQLRLLLLTSLLLCTTVLLNAERASRGDLEPAAVFTEPPAYLHARGALRFDLSGLEAPATNHTEAALMASAQSAEDATARAQAHLELAVYYKMQGRTREAREERRKAEYWRRVSAHVPDEEPATQP
jgi:hypothetical protein